MTPESVVAAVIVLSLIIYALSAGADFGGGVWDLFAFGERREKQRKLIADAIAPIWEANHVWLIVVIVLMFVCFPPAFAAITTAMHIPLLLVLLGIVLRGSAFVFRAYGTHTPKETKLWGRIFAIASVVTPIMLGVTLGGIASGSMRMDSETGRVATDFVSEWAAPFPFVVGFFVLALFAFTAAVYLTNETENEGLQDDFRKMAFASAIAVGVLALPSALLAKTGAPLVWEGLTARPWSVPLHAFIGISAITVFWALRGRRYAVARYATMAQVGAIVLAWGIAQFPYLAPPDWTIASSAAPRKIQVLVLWILAAGGAVTVPAFVVLYRVFKGPPGEPNALE